MLKQSTKSIDLNSRQKIKYIVLIKKVRKRMYTPISIQHKKDFIQWFLRHYTLKKYEANWLLNFLITKDKFLKKVSFVHDVRFCPRGIILSSACSDEVPFL